MHASDQTVRKQDIQRAMNSTKGPPSDEFIQNNLDGTIRSEWDVVVGDSAIGQRFRLRFDITHQRRKIDPVIA